MDVLRPQLVWVENRCYRFFDSDSWQGQRSTTYLEDLEDMECPNEEDTYDENILVVPDGGIMFKHSFHVPKDFFPFIAGTKHTIRKRLETEAGVSIQIPRIGQDGDIVITGYNAKNIRTARRRLDLLVEASRKKLKPTHFLSVPLNDGHIIMKFNEFKTNVLNDINPRGADNTIFQTPSKLHLTLGLLILLDDVERNQAIEALDYCKDNIIKPILDKQGKVKVRLQGVEIMNDDPTEATVLYAIVQNAEDGLQEISDKTMEYFNRLGIAAKWQEKVKLHATLMNIKFKYEGEEHQNVKYKDTFDASEILKVHKETFFGEIPLKQIHISQRHTISSNGYYQATTKIQLNDD